MIAQPMTVAALLTVLAPTLHGQDASTLAEPENVLPEEAVAWVTNAREASFPIASLTSSDFTDLAFLQEVLDDRRIVQLGESGHGFGEFISAKVRLVRFLHQEMGFDVIAFETSQFECAMVQRRIGSVTPEELMRGCLVGTLVSAEMLPLFEYVVETHNTSHPLTIAGFDIQTSTRTANERPAFWRDLLLPNDPAYAARVSAMDSTFLALRFDRDQLPNRSEQLIAGYQELFRYLSTLAESHATESDWHLGMRLAESSIGNIHQLLAIFAGEDFNEIRDEGMADNLRWLADDRYPDRRIITWGHNFHIRHANPLVSLNPVRTMGHWMAETHRADLYTVGLYTRWGRGVMPNGQMFNVVPPESGSLESILGHVGSPYLFVDLETAASTVNGDWVTAPIVTKTWGQADITMTLLEQYDAVLFIDRVSAPGRLR